MAQKIANLLLLLLLAGLICAAVAAVAGASPPPYACDEAAASTREFRFCNKALPVGVRASDLVSRLTLDEKISQLVNAAAAIPRLGVPAYEWWSEALHGVADVGRGIRLNGTIPAATSFPQVILTAASFDPSLWYRIGKAIGIEARAVYNAGQAKGLTFWAPNINIFRDPRWGRGQETAGEDPLMAGKYAAAFVRGMQGDPFEDDGKVVSGGRLQASACCKHFTAYDLENWGNTTRFKFDARVTLQDLADTYQPPFQSCVEKGRASGIMCAYNRVNGVPSCANYNLLSNIARKYWGFQGYITSDCDAVSIIHDVQGYAKTPEEAVADVLIAGMDVNCGSYLQKHTKSAVERMKVLELEIDRALLNLFSVRMRLGLFDGNPSKQSLGNIGPNQVCSKDHHNLALEAARNGIVLLKNSQRLLPLSKTHAMTLAVIGPNANSAQTLLGNYAGNGCKSVTPLQALQNYVRNTKYLSGCNTVACTNASIDLAVKVAREADQVVLVMGLDQTQEREEHDRNDLVLPGQQQSLITSVAAAAKKPVVLVLLCGGPVDVSFAKHDPHIGSILWAGYPGEAGGIALAEVIFGDHNPGGRLPITWYPQEFIKVPMTDMRMRSNRATGYPGRTYRFYKGKKVYDFGYGLSYTNYSYKFSYVTPTTLFLNQSLTRDVEKFGSAGFMPVSMLANVCNQKKIAVGVEVTNQGEMAGTHPVLLFVEGKKMKNGSPMKQLAAFQRVKLDAGKSAKVEFELCPCKHLSTAMADGLMVVNEGAHFLTVGNEEYPINIVI